ncbi:MAG: hypothetical protein JNK87_16755 [Bryobacterales bacterium]|nr:hypothetical protein [Bryobacterales bacterium]
MANQPAQSFSSHTKWSPPFHFFLTPILFFNVLYQGRILMRDLSFDAMWSVAVASALLVGAFLIRIYSLKVQDRLIRLEERLRMKELLAPALYQRALQLTEKQLVALRFASDEELAARVTEALDQNLEPKQIKERVKNWRPDHFRV